MPSDFSLNKTSSSSRMEVDTHAPVTPLLAVVLCSVTLKWLISLGPYSGQDTPPTYGDYEAQRHWMEVAYALPLDQWYVNGSDNDLLYWGLDYPPLTAYHSWLCGYVAANYLEPQWVQLRVSRGHESYTHKVFMRYTVLLADLLIYTTALLAIYRMSISGTAPKLSPTSARSWLLLTLLYPGLSLIDYGHFQYNCVSLGFFLWSVIFIQKDRHLLASVSFCVALNYKQMELYHAPPIFCYLLAVCYYDKLEYRIVKLAKISGVVIMSFAICWLPFLRSKDLMLQVLSRLFPFSRGLYEDKVSNIWCSLSVVIKLKSMLSSDQMALICLLSTALFLLPSSVCLLRTPSKLSYLYSLVNSSLVFFLFSFQVHEKSILLVAIPVCLLICHHPRLCAWFLFISTFSMFPLLHKDGLALQYFCTQFLFVTAFYQLNSHGGLHQTYRNPSSLMCKIESMTLYLCPLSVGISVILCVCHMIMAPPSHLPDLYPLLISVYSCAHFIAFLAYFHTAQFSLSTKDFSSSKLASKKTQ